MSQAITRASAEEIAQKLPETVFTARYDEKMETGKNLLWCSTFQLAWDSLGRDVLGGDPELQGTPPLQASLNRHFTGGEDLDEKSHIAMAGFGRDRILERIREELEKRFAKGGEPALLPDVIPPDNILAYAYLYKNLEFKVPFQDLGPRSFWIPQRAGAPRQVQAFGLEPGPNASGESQEKRQQATVLHYRDDEDFAIELQTKSLDDRLLLARFTPCKTLKETTEAAMERILDGSCDQPALGDDETLQVPKADFDLTRQFPEIEGRYFLNRGFEECFIAAAIQNIRFKLNEKGALLKSEAAIFAALGMPEGPQPRHFNLCTPHLVLLVRREATHPYFALWVANAELAVPAKLS